MPFFLFYPSAKHNFILSANKHLLAKYVFSWQRTQVLIGIQILTKLKITFLKRLCAF